MSCKTGLADARSLIPESASSNAEGTIRRDTSAIEERFFDDREDMTCVLAREITVRLANAIAVKGSASLVASGGVTPIDLYGRLSSAELDWSKIEVTVSDELWVSPTEDGSNEKLIRISLLRNGASEARFYPLKTAHAHAGDAELSVHGAISAMARPFDVTLLGMGLDGHTASLHPYADGLAEALDVDDPALARSIRPRNLAQAGERMSLTLRAILSSRVIVILIQGADKLAALREVMSNDDAMVMPVRAVLHQNVTPVQIFWTP